MAEVIELAKYVAVAAAVGTQSAEVQPLDSDRWSRSSQTEVSNDFLSAAAVRKLDDQSPIGRLLNLVEEALRRLERCQELLDKQELFSADDELMACKRLFSEMLMFRGINDSLGLVSWKVFQAAQMTAITDAPTLPEALHRVLTRVWASPFMKFEEACLLAEEIEGAASIGLPPGYREVSEELLTEQPED
jgi:hypothetical protein